MDAAHVVKGCHPDDPPSRPAQREVLDHAASECTSLHCPLHAWVCDLNGNLVFATARSVPPI